MQCRNQLLCRGLATMVARGYPAAHLCERFGVSAEQLSRVANAPHSRRRSSRSLIGAGGSLVKYGGGLERKRWLLAHEGVVLTAPGGPRRG